MVKNKKLIVILAIFVLSAALFIGCSAFEGEETPSEDKTTDQAFEDKATDEAVEDETTDEAVEDETTDETVEDEAIDQTEAQSQTTVSGTLKAVDADNDAITITTESSDELVLKVTNESEILVDGSPSTLVQLATKTGSKVSVEYHDEAKVTISVSIQD